MPETTTFVLDNVYQFPAGTTVGLYAEGTFPSNSNGPVGTALDTEVMGATSLTFSGLEYGTTYVAAADFSGTWRRVKFTTDELELTPVYYSDEQMVDLGVIREVINVKFDAYGATGDGTTDDTDAINLAIEELNEGRKSLYFPAGDYLISGPLDTITADDIEIFGDGQGASRIKLSDNVGTFFNISDTNSNVARANIHDLGLYCTGTPTAPALVCLDVDDSVIENVRVTDVAGLTKLGGTGKACNRLRFIGVSGTILTGSVLDWIWIYSGFGCKFLGCHLNSGISTQGSYVQIGGAAEESDTIAFDECVFFAQPSPGGTQGKPTAFYIDAEQASVNNVWVTNGTFDGTHTAAIFYRGDSTVDTARNFTFHGNRFETAAGKCVNFDHAGAGSNPLQRVKFTDNSFFFGNDGDTNVPVQMTGTAVHGVSFDNNTLFEMGTGTKAGVFTFGIGNWEARGNHVRKTSNGTALDCNFIFITSADVDNFHVSGNVTATTNTGYFNHYAYAALSYNRVVNYQAGGDTSLDGVRLLSGTGTPESNVVAPIGSLYVRKNGGAGTTLYVKESGASNTGWVAK